MPEQPRREFLKKTSAMLSGGAAAKAWAAPDAIRIGLFTDSDPRWGAHLSAYLDGIAKSKGISEVAIADATGRNFERARSVLAGRFPNLRIFHDSAELLDKVKPLLVVVAMEAHRSPPAIRAALERNCHVLTEKPACVRLDDFAR